MRFDRILLDILDWIRRSLWFEKGKIIREPYQIVESIPSRYGILRQVVRDTPKAVRTWEFYPYKSKDNPKPRSVRICCDFLELITGRDRLPKTKVKLKPAKGKRSHHTHRLHVLSVSHDLDEYGSYESEILFDGVFQWQIRISNRDESIRADHSVSAGEPFAITASLPMC
ncbi:hypothetical protein HC762_00050 [bacterium]|nr:hypothetical protein [bacterium]